ncbi:MAG: hypothetical protein JWN73_607 [Betaproteobacteria bacterium]|nr:hypothetical protein [Betaproteobacteria bacterium]
MHKGAWACARLVARVPAMAAFLLLLALPLTAGAWGPDGHQQIGALADQLIAGTRAETQVKSILGGMSLRTVAVWADCAKGVKDGRYANDPQVYPECVAFDPESKRFESFVLRNPLHGQYHYTDVSNFEDRYGDFFGTNGHDVVHAINAAILVLRGKPQPRPFAMDRKEALMLLAHYAGDVHQPLHAVAIYLDEQGQPVDPDHGGDRLKSGNAGGNALRLPLADPPDPRAPQNLHSFWDAIPTAYKADGPQSGRMLQEARQVPATAGDPLTWAAAWAGDTITSGRGPAFQGLAFTAVAGASPRWNVAGLDANYRQTAEEFKFHQLAKGGARLAELLRALWPDPHPPAAEAPASAGNAPGGYLSDNAPLSIDWLPPAPAPGSAREREDIAVFRATRRDIGLARGQLAAEDDVFGEGLVAARFAAAAGVDLAARAPTLLKMIRQVQVDADHLVSLVKRPVRLPVKEHLKDPDRGRYRPFVMYPAPPSCLFPRDLVPGHRDNDLAHNLKTSGSYPSTHALFGLLTGMILAEALPARADALMRRGVEFGDSRVICGFHYKSDVEAGRQAATFLYGQLRADPVFAADLRKLGEELRTAGAK